MMTEQPMVKTRKNVPMNSVMYFLMTASLRAQGFSCCFQGRHGSEPIHSYPSTLQEKIKCVCRQLRSAPVLGAAMSVSREVSVPSIALVFRRLLRPGRAHSVGCRRC